MRILDEDADKALSRVTILLTKEEASELLDSLEGLLGARVGHEHVSSANFEKEITISLYDFADISGFNERTQVLIRDDR